MKWNTEPLYDDDGIEWKYRHSDRHKYLEAAMKDVMLYLIAVTVWLSLLLIEHGPPL